MQLTSEQINILNYTNSSFRVLAAAGSAKTTTMAFYVKSEIESKRSLPEQICFITFTRFAAGQIKSKVRGIIGKQLPILCGTFHSSMFKLLKKANIHSPEPKNLYDARMTEWVEFVLEQMRNKHKDLCKLLNEFRCLIIDEFQDLDEHQFEFVKLFKEINPAIRIIAIGDLAQNIYRFRGTSNEFLRTRLKNEIDQDLKTFKLRTNFRSSQEILKFTNKLFEEEIKENKILPMFPATFSKQGTKPEYYEYAVNPGKGFGEYEELVVKTLLPIIKEAKKYEKSIALIFPILKCGSFQLISALLRQFSRESGYSFDIHEISKEDETCSTVEFTYNPKSKDSPIQCSSFHSSKGLEWDIVALINITEDMYNARGNEEDDEAFVTEKTNLLYVGITRAVERLLIFANANMGGRHRHFARLGEKLSEVVDFTPWGNEIKDIGPPKFRPIGVRDLIRKLPQHPDLYKKVRECSENIPSYAMDGHSMILERVYSQMKIRNRELAFGTFIDWKLKQELCSGTCKSLQDCLIELSKLFTVNKSFHKTDAIDDVHLCIAKLDVFCMNASYTLSEDLVNYVTASRYLDMYRAKFYAYVDTFKSIYKEIEKTLTDILNKKEKSLIDEYVIAQSREFYIKNFTKEIQAVSAPQDSYQGLPYDFENFIFFNIPQMKDSIVNCLNSIGLTATNIHGDVPLESPSLIIGEADLVHEDGVIIEVKCSASSKAIDLRDSGECKNLLQLLTYVALARHGTISVPCKYAFLVNPLTNTWERYDIEKWSMEDSKCFFDCLEELKARI